MQTISDLEQVTHLSEEQCNIIANMAANMQVMADISRADMFIDCLSPEKSAAIVIAEASPSTAPSLYRESVLGEIAFEETEPGVLFSLKNGKSIIGSRGISQENIVMQQDIVPITDPSGTTIAVLIKEHDISDTIRNEHKMKSLLKSTDKDQKQEIKQSLIIQELHHRVKNNLQVISSMLRLQMRRSASDEVVRVFSDSLNRIASMGKVHDYLAKNGLEEVDVTFVMEQIGTLLVSSSTTSEQSIEISVKGKPLFLPSDKATSVALVVNELIQNGIKHAFYTTAVGKIEIKTNIRKQMVNIIVSDNGDGMDHSVYAQNSSSLGLHLVEMLVEEELEGILSVFHSNRGTNVSLTFPITNKVME